MTSILVESKCDLESGVTVIRLERDYGSTQFLNLKRLEAQLHSALDAAPKTVLLDLCDTDSIGAAFLSALLHCHARATRVNCLLALCMLNAFSAEVVSVARLDMMCPTFGSRQSAIELLGQSVASLPASQSRLNDGKVSGESAQDVSRTDAARRSGS